MTKEQEKALREYLQESIVPLIEQVLVQKLGQGLSFAAEQLIQPKRTWEGLTDEDKQIAFDDTQEGGGFWEFADAIEVILKRKNTQERSK